MIVALLLAVAVVGHDSPRIDPDYAPKAGDRALLGAWNLVFPAETIQRAWCYMTLNDARSAFEAMGETVGDGGLSAKPDAYAPAAGTSVLVKAITEVELAKSGTRPKFSVVKVQILEGTFKGKELYTAPHSVFRYREPKAARRDPEVIRPAGRR